MEVAKVLTLENNAKNQRLPVGRSQEVVAVCWQGPKVVLKLAEGRTPESAVKSQI